MSSFSGFLPPTLNLFLLDGGEKDLSELKELFASVSGAAYLLLFVYF